MSVFMFVYLCLCLILMPMWLPDWAASTRQSAASGSGCGSSSNYGCAAALDMGLEVCLDFPFLLLVVLLLSSSPVHATFPQARAYNLHIICVHFILFPQLRSLPSLCVGCSIYDGRGQRLPAVY